MSNSTYRKVKQYLEILKDQRYDHFCDIVDIRVCPCGYKEGQNPPPLSDFVPYEKDTFWGSGWDSHAWFYIPVDVPEEMQEAPVLMQIQTDRNGWDADNSQFIAYVDGKLWQGLDTNHTQLLLEGKNHYEVYLYGYTGPRSERTKLFASLCNVRPEVEKLWYDIRVPFDSLNYLAVDSEEYVTILERLSAAVDLLDLYAVGSPAFFASVAEASGWMDQKFYGEFCRPSYATTVCIGHTHIDCAWLWTLRQTREKVQRSFATVLELMKRYPEYRFMSSQAFLYQNLKEDAPDLYEEVKQRVREGRWECEGSMWVEADCNLPNGESLIRQVIYGKRFFRTEFGVENRILWLPDVFGYSPALPQILRKSGVEWFVTSKISWNDENKMPYKIIESDVKSWLTKKNTAEKRIRGLTEQLAQRKSDQEQILFERIRDREHAEVYTAMLEKCEAEIRNLTAEIAAIRDYDATIRKRKAEMKSSIDILGEIIKDGAISDTNLRMLVDNIVIHEQDGKLSINIDLKAAFCSHLDLYDEDGILAAKAYAAN